MNSGKIFGASVLVTALLCTSSAFTQPEISDAKPWEKEKSAIEKELLRKRNSQPGTRRLLLQQVTPGVVHIPLTKKRVGANGKGADVYAMMPYNMPCLVLDSTFKSKMPVAGSGISLQPKSSSKEQQ